jgi:CheY-like chemotaxis protein
MNEERLDVLVVDDDDITSETVERALRKVEGCYRVVAASDGADALRVLRGETTRQVRKPFVVLLDLNMPTMNGFEFLEQLRNDRRLRDSVVFVLTTSDSDADRSRAYHELIAGYMVKSSVGAQFSKLSTMLREYSAAVRLPA